MPDLIHLIYSSTPFGYDPADLNGILVDARRCNARDGVTGALVCRHDVFLQYLEGPAGAVQNAYQRISRDDRHVDVAVRSQGPLDARVFGDWDMLHDPAQSIIWTAEEVADGTLDLATDTEYFDMFVALSTRIKAANG